MQFWDESKQVSKVTYDTWWKHYVFYNPRDWFLREYFLNLAKRTDVTYDEMWTAESEDDRAGYTEFR